MERSTSRDHAERGREAATALHVNITYGNSVILLSYCTANDCMHSLFIVVLNLMNVPFGTRAFVRAPDPPADRALRAER